MSEQKSKYVPGTVYTQQFACTLPEGWGDVSEETITPTPSSLPTLLARMVNEYAWELDPLTFSQETVEQFSTILLSAAQPLLAEYLNKLANPPMVVKKQDDEAGLPIMVRAVLAAERQRAEEALALVRAGKGVSAARKHLGLE
jgi:hypothetical protein